MRAPDKRAPGPALGDAGRASADQTKTNAAIVPVNVEDDNPEFWQDTEQDLWRRARRVGFWSLNVPTRSGEAYKLIPRRLPRAGEPPMALHFGSLSAALAAVDGMERVRKRKSHKHKGRYRPQSGVRR